MSSIDEEKLHSAEMNFNKSHIDNEDELLHVRVAGFHYKIKAAGEKSRQPEASASLHHHEYGEIHFVVEGCQTYLVGDKTVTVGVNEALYIPAFRAHKSVDTSENLKKIALRVVVCQSQYMRFLTAKRTLSEINHIYMRDAREIRSLLNLIISEAAEKKDYWLTNANILSSLMMTTLARIAENDIPEEITSFDSKNAVIAKRMKSAERFIHENIAKDIKCCDVAAYLHISQRQLNRNVKEYYGISLYELIARIRFEIACLLITTRDIEINQVCSYLGFADTSSFNRFFKSHSKMSPTEWKRGHIDEYAKDFDFTAGNIYEREDDTDEQTRFGSSVQDH